MALGDLRNLFGDRFADVWVLLSDTDRFLSRARLAPTYERRLRDWRKRLERSRGHLDEIRAVRDEIIAVRKALRAQGWELRLGSLDVAVKGYRSDDSSARGFRRMVLFLTPGANIYYEVGDANHNQLDELLRQRLQAMHIHVPLMPHYLWYRVSAGVIELAGADSESAEALERLKVFVDERKSDLVRTLRRLS